MELYKWINHYKEKLLTINTIKNWNINEIKDVVIFDRNFEEYFIWENTRKNENYTAEYFFQGNRCRIKYNGNLTWDIEFDVGTITHPVELDVTDLGTGWAWMPLNGEYMTINTVVKDWKITDLPQNEQHNIHFTKFNDNTRIGWRGPIMLWSDVKNAQDVYWSS